MATTTKITATTESSNAKGSEHNSARSRMTSQISRYLAAEFIARSDFPQKDNLPKLRPPAFNTFGHQPLFDYKLFLKIIWQVIEEIKAAVTKGKGSKTSWIVGGLIAGVLISGLGFIVADRNESAAIILIIIGLLTSIIIIASGSNRAKNAIKKKVAEIRAKAIENLIKDKWEVLDTEVSLTIDNEYIRVGDGAIDGTDTPVIIIDDNEQPFSGYGRLQAENLFICRPKDMDYAGIHSVEDIRKTVTKAITGTVTKSGIKEITFGHVALIHGASLLIDSVWLDEEKVPKLWLNREQLESIDAMEDSKSSIRNYFAAQVLFPQYMTAATFFIRIFLAGNSASCQITVTTLGPPTIDLDYFLKRLMRHKMEKKEGAAVPGGFESHAMMEQSDAYHELRLVHLLSQSIYPFQSDVNIVEVENIKLKDELKDKSEAYKKEYQEIIRNNVIWPGYFTYSPNLRENSSFTFTTDFFGRPEAIASVKTLYDQISRATLDCLDRLGFDISDYRDREGNYSINADKIDQLVVGEKIHIEKSKNLKDRKSSGTEAKEKVEAL